MSVRLWAKSWDESKDGPPPPHVFLPGHLRDVLAAADQVLDATGEDQLRAFGLNPDDWIDRFRRVVRVAAAVHDLGKANNHFQGMVTSDRSRIGKPQGLRHEWVSWLILQRDDVHHWLLPALGETNLREANWTIMLWAVAGHHPAFHRQSPPTDVPDSAGSEMSLLIGHTDFQSCLDWLGEAFDLDTSVTPRLNDATLVLSEALSQIHREAVIEPAQLWTTWRDERRTPGMSAFVAAVKNCLVAADVAGSALPREIADPLQRQHWITSSLQRVPVKSDFDAIIADRLTVTTNGVSVTHELRPFQRDVADLAGEVTLVKAGCGSGKTLAAYHWARERHPNRRLYMCYPTTGTATEGFRDYVFDENSHSPKFGAHLFHGRADVDVKLILNVTDQFDDSDDEDALTRIESLDAWSTPIVTCTVDTVLGVMQNNRRGLYSWPALAGAAFVFDEVHSYDADLFGALLRFVRDLRGLPILLMTASLPESRMKRLRNVVARRGTTLVEIGGPSELETLPRYHRGPEVDGDELVAEVLKELRRTDRPGKVLWVCNTVNRALEAADRCRVAGLEPLIYHSRFRYEDRVRQHGRVIDAFRSDCEPALAICTQVAEMSLDLSASLLVTELAPISALIQRLGRLNRRAKTVGDPTMPFIVTLPVDKNGKLSALPYSNDDLMQSKTWLENLPKQITQRDLVEVWESLPKPAKAEEITLDCMWLDGGPRREVKELRQASPGITVVLQRDLATLQSLDPLQCKRLAEVLLPMPTPPDALNWRNWPLFKGVRVALDQFVDYQPDRGAKWIIPSNSNPEQTTIPRG
jgi:CRISPR-associated endonuclease/helicase Cas3